MSFAQVLFQSLSLLLPILCSGLVLILVIRRNWFAWLDKPLDLGWRFRGQPLFGRNKTFRGLVVHIVVAVVVVSALHPSAMVSDLVSPMFKAEPIGLGLLLAIGYVGAELVNSFIKRRLGVPAGGQSSRGQRLQRFFDTADGIFGSGVVVVLHGVTPIVLMVSGVLGLAAHLSTDALMRKLRLKKH